MTLFEALELIADDAYAEQRTPGELAALINPWLGYRDDRIAWPDTAPLLLRFIGDAPGWNRFEYRDGAMRLLAAAHFVLRAAHSLAEEEDLIAGLNLIRLGRQICRETLYSSPLASRRPIEQERK